MIPAPDATVVDHDVVSRPATEPRVLTPGVIGGFLAVTLLLVAAAIVAVANLGTVYRSATAVAQTNAVKAQLESLLATLIDAETGERGFVITGDASYLEPYNRAVAAIAPAIANTRQLTGNNIEQQNDLDLVVADTKIKLDELAEATGERRGGGFDAAQRVVLMNIGKRTMDRIRRVVSRMEAREDALLARQTAASNRAYRTARITTVVAAGIGLLIVGLLFSATRGIGAERKRALSLAEHLRVTLSSIGDGVIATDAMARVTHVNPVAEHLTGWTQAEAIGKQVLEIFVIVNEESRHPVDNPIERVLREGVIVGLANHTVLIARNGPEIPVDDSAAPIKGTDGQVNGAVLVFRDVTGRRRVERERSALISELEAAVRARDDFLSIASHELRNPVNAVQLQLVGILRAFQRETDGLDTETLRDRVAQANTQVGRLTRLLDNLLDVSRITAGSFVLEPEDVDLNELVATVIEQLRGESSSGQIAFASDGSVVGRWDRLRVEQILSNVLSNAIKYGNGQAIAISLVGDRRIARIAVKDHGIGIAPEQHERLFARFERGVSRRQYGGFGLGLWITRQLVDAMGGTISVESRAGQGATFSIVLPLRATEPTGMGDVR
jgi:PAS domain S-box-containing protein